MNQQPDIEELLERARRGLSPRETDEARVFAALSERLFTNGGDVASRELPATVPAPPVPPPAALRARGLARWLWKAVLPLTAAGALGLWLQLPREHEAPPRARPARIQQASVELSVAPVLALDTPSLPQPSDPAQAEPAKPEKKKPARKKCAAANGGERPCPSRPTPTALAATDAPPAPAPTSLRLELDALRSAERALREHRPQDALATLDAFERAVAGGGAMQEERAAAASIARCAMATQGRDALFGAFVKRYPASAYAARVRQSCQQP